MKKEVNWLSSRCASLVLIELAKKPGTPMDIRIRTGLTKNNYVNIILKRLESEGIIKCLNLDEKIGKVFCINPESKKRVEQIFRKNKTKQGINPLPNLNWTAYGRLLCKYCRQLRMVFKRACELKQEGREITVSSLKEKLPGMATSNLYRALDGLVELGVISCKDTSSRKFTVTEEGLAIVNFQLDVLNIDW